MEELCSWWEPSTSSGHVAHGCMRMFADQARGQCYSVLSIVCAEICTKCVSEKTLETSHVYGPFTLTDAAVEAMHEVGGHPLLHTLSESTTDSNTQEHTSVLLQRMDHWKVTKSEWLNESVFCTPITVGPLKKPFCTCRDCWRTYLESEIVLDHIVLVFRHLLQCETTHGVFYHVLLIKCSWKNMVEVA